MNLETPRDLQRHLRQELKKISSVSHCPNCGGLLPEIGFKYEGLTYHFTCYKIKKEEKAIVETDYAKLAHYHQKP
jgi:hypothetical protein